MNIIGIDPGTICLGWCMIVSTKSSLYAVDYGTIKPRKSMSAANRMKYISNELQSKITQQPDSIIAIETPFVGKFPKAALALGKIVGVVMQVAWQAGLEIYEYTPTDVKKAVHSGKASKESVALMVSRIFNLAVQPESDAADALAVAVCHANKVQT